MPLVIKLYHIFTWRSTVYNITFIEFHLILTTILGDNYHEEVNENYIIVPRGKTDT